MSLNWIGNTPQEVQLEWKKDTFIELKFEKTWPQVMHSGKSSVPPPPWFANVNLIKIMTFISWIQMYIGGVSNMYL